MNERENALLVLADEAEAMLSTASSLEDAARAWHQAHALDRLATSRELTFNASFRVAAVWLSAERKMGQFLRDFLHPAAQPKNEAGDFDRYPRGTRRISLAKLEIPK